MNDEHLYIVGVDPGETTGIAHHASRTTFSYGKEHEQVDQMIRAVYEYCKSIKALKGKTPVIACESFIPYTPFNNKHARAPMHVIGAMRAVAVLARATFVLQDPFLKQTITDDMLTEYSPSNQHEKDAAIHCLIYLERRTPALSQSI